MKTARGPFITLEGIDGCGKSTQAAHLDRWLQEQGWSVERTFEPGGWEGGRTLRSLVLEGEIAWPEQPEKQAKSGKTPAWELTGMIAPADAETSYG